MNRPAISCEPPNNWMNLTRQGCGAMAAEPCRLSRGALKGTTQGLVAGDSLRTVATRLGRPTVSDHLCHRTREATWMRDKINRQP